ncbi:MAG: zinc ribbon domain-containing protein [Candidatus Omnitrophica bacterium]|nr:zinc ribbon domain-containing protein [Candidatus Omnitrophota bacterium]
MPTYEYECETCGHRFEEFQSIKAEPLKVCPQCKGNVKRLLGTGAGFIFKGSGFYQTDYRSSSYQKKAEAEKKPLGSQRTDNREQSTDKAKEKGKEKRDSL